ncbi:MAG: hypothetical protein PHE36_13565, partial [Novosphingobium sp.]|nr:hypothetical protein [Novosphingobium sp.]
MGRSLKAARRVTAHKAVRSVPPDFAFCPVRLCALEELLAAPVWPKVLNIVAPVGYGKTVLMAALFSELQERGEKCFWTTLDDRDVSVPLVLNKIETCVYGEIEPLHPAEALFRGKDVTEMRVSRLLDTIVRQGEAFITFIDNCDNCTDPALGYLLDRLVFEAPTSVRFVFSSASKLPFNLVQAKLQGLLREVGYADLSFTATEVRTLLGRQLSAAIGALGVDMVVKQTEGWPAAVRMLQIALAASGDPLAELERFSGSNEDIVDLLNREVLSGFAPKVRDFLLGIAALRTFSADLCRHATGCDEAGGYIEALLRGNVFIIPLDRERSWYRLHGLFRQYLLKEAQRLLPSTQRLAILDRASEWCARSGQSQDAIQYALAAGAYERASTILERTAVDFIRDRGDVLQFSAWIEALALHGQPLGPETGYWYVWALLLQRRYDEGRQQIQRLVRSVGAESGEDILAPDMQRRLGITRVCLDIFSDRLVEANRNAAQWLEGLRADDAPFDVTSAYCTRSLYFSSAFMFAEAREAAHAAQIAAFEARSFYANAWIIVLNALPSVLEGNFAMILPELRSALLSARTRLGENSGIGGTLALLAADCAVGMGLNDEARALLSHGLVTAQIHGVVDTLLCGFDAAVKLWTGGAGDPAPIQLLRTIA